MKKGPPQVLFDKDLQKGHISFTKYPVIFHFLTLHCHFKVLENALDEMRFYG
jgi:hypothetical protein